MWRTESMPDGSVHVFPDDERKDHKFNTDYDCECIARVQWINGRALVVHDAFDGRQAVEQAEALLRKL